MRKFKFFLDYNKEEKWLNSMAQLGFEMEDAKFGYKFRSGISENTNIRIDYRTFKNKDEFTNYCTLFEDSGWKHISGSMYSGSQYFKKINNNGMEDIFSDLASKAGRYKRVANMYLSLSMVFLPIFVANLSSNVIQWNAFLDPAKAYYTPGLWQMEGLRFWAAFLFETPFAFMRLFAWCLFPLVFLIYFAFSLKAYILYKASQKNN